MKRLIRVSFIISFILILSACSKQKEEIMDSNYIREEIVMDDGFEIEAIDFDEGKGYAIGNTGKTGKGIVILNNDGTVDGRIDFDNRVSGDILDFCKIKEGYQILIMNHNSIDILKINNQGKQKENFSLCTEKGESVSWFDVQQFDEKEGLYTASNGELYYFAEDGTLKNRIKIEEGILCSLLVKEESVFLTYFTVSGEKLKIYEYKKSAIKNSKNGERIVPVSYETGISPYSNPYLIDSRNGQYDFYLNDGRNVYGYSLGTEAAEKVFNWLSCDFNGTEIKQILSKTETVFFIISTKNKTAEVFELKMSNSDSKEKKTVIIATAEKNIDLDKAVLNFNRENEEIQLIVNDYSEQEQPYTALNQDIITSAIKNRHF